MTILWENRKRNSGRERRVYEKFRRGLVGSRESGGRNQPIALPSGDFCLQNLARSAVGQSEIGEMRAGIASQACALDSLEDPVGLDPLGHLAGGMPQVAEFLGQLFRRKIG